MDRGNHGIYYRREGEVRPPVSELGSSDVVDDLYAPDYGRMKTDATIIRDIVSALLSDAPEYQPLPTKVVKQLEELEGHCLRLAAYVAAVRAFRGYYR